MSTLVVCFQLLELISQGGSLGRSPVKCSSWMFSAWLVPLPVPRQKPAVGKAILFSLLAVMTFYTFNRISKPLTTLTEHSSKV